MNAGNLQKKRILWARGILNSFLVFIIGIALYSIPGLVVGISMALDLGPRLRDNAAVSAKISQAIPSMYNHNLYLALALVIVLSLLIFLRARALARFSSGRSISNGILVGAVPAGACILSMALGKVGYLSILAAIVFIGIGILGGSTSRSSTTLG